MNRILLSACALALVFSGCREGSSSTSHRSTSRMAPSASAEPVIPTPSPMPKVVVPEPTPIAIAKPDVPAQPQDLLALTPPKDDVDPMNRAEALRKSGDVKGALVEARRSLSTQPKRKDGLALVGTLSRRTHQFDLAAEAYSRLALLEPTDPMPRVQQARALIERHDFQDAETAAKQAVQLDDQCAEGFQALGRAYLSDGDLSGAIASFQKVIALVPDQGWALNDLGLAYLRSSQNELALEALQKAAIALPKVAFVQNNLGLALERTGDQVDAALAYQHAIDLDPHYVKAHVNADRLGSKIASAKVVEPKPMLEVAPADPNLVGGTPDDVSGLRIQFQ